MLSLFDRCVELYGNKTAIDFQGVTLTYKELQSQINQLANYLEQSGVSTETKIGLYLERSPDVLVGLLAILRLGATYIPFDPAYPKERLDLMFTEAQPSFILTQSTLTQLPTTTAKTICLDLDKEAISKCQDEFLSKSDLSGTLAYIMYTSGSTGKPKGVMMPRSSVELYLNAISDVLLIQPEDNYLHTASFSFSSSVRQLLVPISQGAKVILASQEQAKNPLGLLELMKQKEVTVSDSIASIWRSLLQAVKSLDAAKRDDLLTNSLRLILLSGDLTPALVLQQIRQDLSSCPDVVNIYGQTETIGVSIHRVPREFEKNEGYVPVGFPYKHNRIYVLDENMQPVSQGEIGELYVSGGCLSKGYLNRPDLTERQFSVNPWIEDCSEDRQLFSRLYRTGDLARQLPDGCLEIRGRADFQVQLRGMRVELGEVESALSQHSAVAQSVVAIREDEPGDKRLVAYVVLVSSTPPKSSEFRQFLKPLLPEYMIPSVFVQLDALPLTPNGKINRQVLPPPAAKDMLSSTPYVAPRTSQEETLVRIWQQVLKLERVGINDNFFDLGGHSLLALRLFTEIEKAFGQNLPLATLYQAHTIAELSSLLSQSKQLLPADCSLVPLQSKGSKLPLFLVPPAGTTVVNLGQLVRYLPPDQPVYGLEPLGMDGQHFPHTCLKAMAAYYIQEIQKLQPQGPYCLVGRCFGGVVVFEMAQQLRAQGQKVALLGILDTQTPPNFSSEKAASGSLKISEERRSLGNYFQYGDYLQPLAIRWQRGRLIPTRFFQSRAAAFCMRALKGAEAGNPVYLFLQQKLFSRIPRIFTLAAHRKSRIDYWAKVYPGTITYFQNSDESMSSITARWSELTSAGLDCQIVPGNHRTMLLNHEYAKAVADKLSACLDKVHTGALDAKVLR